MSQPSQLSLDIAAIDEDVPPAFNGRHAVPTQPRPAGFLRGEPQGEGQILDGVPAAPDLDTAIRNVRQAQTVLRLHRLILEELLAAAHRDTAGTI